MAKPGPPSQIDSHPERDKIIAAILAGKKLVDIARKWGIDDSAVHKFATRVRKNVAVEVPDVAAIPKLVIPPSATPRERAAAVAEWCRVRIEYESARPGASVKDLAAMTAQLTSAIRMLARLDGSLDVSEAHILRSPAWHRVQAVYDTALTYEGALTARAVRERVEAEFARVKGE